LIPSAIPSTSPSAVPSDSMSVEPSSPPSLSYAPSNLPSTRPSSVPSEPIDGVCGGSHIVCPSSKGKGGRGSDDEDEEKIAICNVSSGVPRGPPSVFETRCVRPSELEEEESPSGKGKGSQRETRRRREVFDNYTCGCCDPNLEESSSSLGFCLGPPICDGQQTSCSSSKSGKGSKGGRGIVGNGSTGGRGRASTPTGNGESGRLGRAGVRTLRGASNSKGTSSGGGRSKGSSPDDKDAIAICVNGESLCIDPYDLDYYGTDVQCGVC
jgi:hypothetical protein